MDPESTSFYGIHIANYLSSCEILTSFHTLVYCLNPKFIRNYKKSFIDLGKNDAIDAFIIADFTRANQITTQPLRGSQFLALQRLTRHRLHLAKALTREKAYMLSNIFLKFSEFAAFYQKKYAEVKTHQHKCTLALTARKLVRLIFGLLAKHQLHSSTRVVQA